MLRNHLKLAVRNLARNQFSSIINIGGLAAGMAVAVLIGFWIWDELSFNTYHENYAQLTQVKRTGSSRGEDFASDSQVSALGEHLRSKYGNHFQQVAMMRRTEEYILSVGENNFTQKGNFIEEEGPEMLSVRMKSGTQKGLRDLNSILLSESVARKLFKGQEALGKTVKINDEIVVTVTGVYEDLPLSSSFREATFLAPLGLFFSMTGLDDNAWTNQNMFIYTLLRKGTDLQEINTLIRDDYAIKAGRTDLQNPPQLFLHPMGKWHFYTEYTDGKMVSGPRLQLVWFNGIIGLFVLILACINFMNLSTARSEKRAKEVGIRKTLGSRRSQVMQQFFGESLMISLLALVGSLVLVQISLPWFNHIADKQIYLPWKTPVFWLIAIAFSFATGLLAGSYPAFYLSSFRPVKALQGAFGNDHRRSLPRQVLVVIQFTISIGLIIGTLIIHRQIQYAKGRPVGYSKAGLIMLPKRSEGFFGKFDLLREELLKTGVVGNVGQCNYPLTTTLGNNSGFQWEGKDPAFNPSFNTIRISHDYGKTIGWEVIAGRDFSREFGTDRTGVIVSESAAKVMGFSNPVGQNIQFPENFFGANDFTILGVTKDLVKESPFEPVLPAIMFLSEQELFWMFIRIKPEYTAAEALPKIERAIKGVIPTAPFDYKFADEEYAAKFKAEERLADLATLFAVLAILISCLGLFGLAVYVTERRTKEIGIRKLLGASVIGVASLLSRDFLKLVAIALLISIPLSYYVAARWLENFSYQMELSWWIFALAGLLAIVIAGLTVMLQSIKAALQNPADSLRTE